jgi:hypothetical protein
MLACYELLGRREVGRAARREGWGSALVSAATLQGRSTHATVPPRSYYASITLGTPAKTFEVVMDTGLSSASPRSRSQELMSVHRFQRSGHGHGTLQRMWWILQHDRTAVLCCGLDELDDEQYPVQNRVWDSQRQWDPRAGRHGVCRVPSDAGEFLDIVEIEMVD